MMKKFLALVFCMIPIIAKADICRNFYSKIKRGVLEF